MDSELKAAVIVVGATVVLILSPIWFANLRWRANVKEYIANGYVQARAPSSYVTIWVKDANNAN